MKHYSTGKEHPARSQGSYRAIDEVSPSTSAGPADCNSAGPSSVDDAFLRQIWTFADEENRADVVESFRTDFILSTVKNHSSSPSKAWKALKESLDVHEEVRRLEYDMDHTAFYDCLSSAYLGVSGTDRRGRPIFWMKSFRNQHLMKKGSPLQCAYTRALLYISEIAYLKTFPRNCGVVVIMDDSRRKAMDFNMAVWVDIFRLINAVFPMRTEEVWACGISHAGRALFKASSSLLNERLHNWKFEVNKEDALEIVSDTTQIPEWWISETHGRRFDVNYDTHWQWERCLARGEETITRKEIMNPTSPWLPADNFRLPSLPSVVCSSPTSRSIGVTTVSSIDRATSFHSRLHVRPLDGDSLDTITEATPGGDEDDL